MNNKRTSTANINFIFILSIILVVVSFSLSNLKKFNKGENLLNEFDSTLTSYEEEISSDQGEIESWKSFVQDLSEFGIDAGNVGLDVLRILFVWIPLFHVFFLFLFSGTAWTIFRPTDEKVLAYRILMTFAYLNIFVILFVLFVGILVHYSTSKKIEMLIFAIQCICILIFNFRNTYSKRIRADIFGSKKE